MTSHNSINNPASTGSVQCTTTCSVSLHGLSPPRLPNLYLSTTQSFCQNHYAHGVSHTAPHLIQSSRGLECKQWKGQISCRTFHSAFLFSHGIQSTWHSQPFHSSTCKAAVSTCSVLPAQKHTTSKTHGFLHKSRSSHTVMWIALHQFASPPQSHPYPLRSHEAAHKHQQEPTPWIHLSSSIPPTDCSQLPHSDRGTASWLKDKCNSRAYYSLKNAADLLPLRAHSF